MILDDTLLKFWELWCEFPKDLAFQNSILGDEPFYKHDLKSTDTDTFFRYCCRDSATTLENSQALEVLLSASSQRHYALNKKLLDPLLYMQCKGFLYDRKTAKARLAEVQEHVYKLQYQLDQQTGFGLGHTCNIANHSEVESFARQVLCYKNNPTKPKKDNEEALDWILTTLSNSTLSEAELGRLNVELGMSLNVKGNKLKTYLYETIGLPKQYKKDADGEFHVTTDFAAMLNLLRLLGQERIRLKKFSTEAAKQIVETVKEITLHRTRAQMLSIVPSSDGRMRYSLNIVGSKTGRITGSKSVDLNQSKRVGSNPQTISSDWDLPEESLLSEGLRTLYIADQGCWIAKCDLKGADGWTIGARLASLGDSTMLDDLLVGLKPAQVVAYIFKYGAADIAVSTRDEIKQLVKKINKDDWEYFFSKKGAWGTCYTMGAKRLAEEAFIESYGKINLSESEVKVFQRAIRSRYNYELYQSHYQRVLDSTRGIPTLTAASGQVRRFYGRKEQILGELVSFEPQANTTYAVNLATLRLWEDQDNRTSANSLRVEPLLSVHDELVMQFKQADTEWAVDKIRSWFNNVIEIAGTKLVIPYDGSYSPSWGDSSIGNI